ncbi:MAG: 16S rRNA (guanine527-N7)-methyltransferase [Candidatus Azotimanducaceae bacterium]|jgi:16S rRNA (guanine527-N7)-methyltransferase
MRQIQLIGNGLLDLKIGDKNGLSGRLSQFVDALIKWNKTYNLTAIRESDQIVSHHILDSLSVFPYIKGSSIIDFGSGAGFPGIPLALIFPEKNFTLLDSNGKKTRFLQQMKIELGLKNCSVIQSRVEDHDGLYDQVCCRAFSSVTNICVSAQHLLKEDGEILALKGKLDTENIEDMPPEFELLATHKLVVPTITAERHLLVLKKQSL